MRKGLLFIISAALLLPLAPAQAAVSVKGDYGQTLSIKSNRVAPGSVIKVSGRGFDETVGIYLAICVIPAKGKAPTPCGGGVNKAGLGEASVWISSNAPGYAVGLTDEFLPGGRFTHNLSVSQRIGKFDCRKVRCAVTVRSDHLRTGDRTQDLFIPITIRK
jgi:hypothetical protein